MCVCQPKYHDQRHKISHKLLTSTWWSQEAAALSLPVINLLQRSKAPKNSVQHTARGRGDLTPIYFNPTSFLVVLFAQMLSFLWRHWIPGRHLNYADQQITAVFQPRCYRLSPASFSRELNCLWLAAQTAPPLPCAHHIRLQIQFSMLLIATPPGWCY